MMNKLVEKDQENVVHENGNYQVISTPKSTKGSYMIVNKSWGVGEGHFDNLPSALSVAEQMNNILVHSIWKKQADEQLEDALYTQPAEDEYEYDFDLMDDVEEPNGNRSH